MSKKKENIRFHFDVVNSVKGGSGKSFFSLQLAAFHALNDRAAYIIDLDLRGTSWEMNYGRYIAPPDLSKGKTILEWEATGHKYPYIDRLMWHYEDYASCGIWSTIKVENSDGKKSTVSLCIAKTGNYHDVDRLEEDLFENTIFQIIMGIRTAEENKDRDVHIILDMPPSYERHAERVLTHLLLSTNSPFEGKDFDYITTLFMMETLAPAHFVQNALYIQRLFKDRQYSSCVTQKLKNGTLRIVPVVNDVMGYIIEGSLNWRAAEYKIGQKREEQWTDIEIGRIFLKDYISKKLYINHVSLKNLKSQYDFYIDAEENEDYIPLLDSPGKELQAFEEWEKSL